MIMELGIGDNKEKHGISIVIDYPENIMTVKKSNNGNEPEIYTFEISGPVNIEAKGREQVFNFRIEPNGDSSDHSGNGSEETGPEAVNDDARVGIEPRVGQNSDLVNSQKTGVSARIESDIVQAMPSFREVTTEEIREEISKFVFLTKTGIRILVALVEKEGSMTRNEIRETGIVVSNITNIFNGLFKLGLIYFDGKEIIKPNLEKIAVSCPWLYSKKIQKIVKTKPDFKLGKSIQRVLYLSCKHPDGLYKNTIIDVTGMTEGGFNFPKRTMIEYDLIEVTYKGNKVIISPKFSVDQMGENSTTSKEATVVEIALAPKTVGAEEQTVDFNTGKEDLAISQEPAVIDTVPVQEVVGAEEPMPDTDEKDLATSQEPAVVDTIPAQEIVKAEPMISINTVEGFNREKLESFVNTIRKGFPVVKLQTLSSQFKTGIKNGGITRLLNAIDKKVEIEVTNIKTGEIMTSWKQRHLKGIIFEDLEVRKKTNNLKDKDTETKDLEEQGITGDIKTNNLSEEAVSKEEIIELTSEDKERLKKDMRRKAESEGFGEPFKNILDILVDSLPGGMKLKDIIEEAEKKLMRKAQIKPYLDILIRQGFVGRNVGVYKLLNI